MVLEAEPDFALRARSQPTILVPDLSMPGTPSPEVLPKIAESSPGGLSEKAARLFGPFAAHILH